MLPIIENNFDSLMLFLAESKYDRMFLLADENTKTYCYPLLQGLLPDAIVIEIKAGEKNKQLDTCNYVWQQLSEHHASRHSLLINLGGGMVSDLGGFVAATYKRGIDFVNIPTSLLAMVDASIGGKTGIDFKGIKNMIGVIALPKLVYVHPIFLQTLTPRHILSGYAEMLKHGMIADPSYFSELLQNKVSDMKDWALLIQKSIEIKNSIVEQDPLEKGIRKSLNFGHTIGHALESYFLEDEENAFLHGEAIAWGMVLESMLSMDLLGMKESDYKQLLQFVENNYRPIKLLASEYETLIAFMNHDKKNIDGKIAFVLLKDIAEVQLDVFCTKQQIQKAFRIINTSHH